MNFGEIVSASRWQLLESIAISPSSPIQLAEKMGTSVAYVSQQLKLLEAANIISKVKTGNAEKGKPRNVYSIVQDIVTVSALMSGSPVQASIHPTTHQKVVLRIWLYKDSELRQPLEKLYREIEDMISEIDGIYVDGNKVYVVSKNSAVNNIIKNFLKENSGIKCEVLKSLKIESSFYVLFESAKKESGK